MSVPQPVFLTATAVVASPLVVLLERGWIDVAGAMERLVLIGAICWVAMRVVVALTFPSPEELRRTPGRPGADQATPPGVPPTGTGPG